MREFLGLAIASAAMQLVACAPKVPDCTDAKVLSQIQTAIPRDAVKHISDNIDAAGNWQRPIGAFLRATLDTFGKAIKVDVQRVTTEGADPTARKSQCAAEITISTPDGSNESRRMTYTIQHTADGEDFLLAVMDYGALLGATAGAFDAYSEQAKAAARKSGTVAANASLVAGAAPKQSCIDDRMAAWKRNFEGRQRALMDEAEKENREFRPLSPVQEDEEAEAALQKARRECPAA